MRSGGVSAWLALALASLALSCASASSAAKVQKTQKAPTTAQASKPPVPPMHMSPQAAQVTNWVIASGDNGSLPFMVIDKVAAAVFVFDGQGQRLGATPALVGITPGDDSSPGVGDRELSDIAPEERTTPAGRFVSRFGTAAGNRKVLWVDYVTSISLHAVITTNKRERRLQRLNSPTPEDNRITFGCINVPARFYAKVVVPNFKQGIGVVYILPEIRTLREVFPAYLAQSQPDPHSEVAR